MAKVIFFLVASLLTTTYAVASGGEGGTANPFAGDVGNAIWTLVIFVLVLIVLGKFAWGPILSALQQREDFITDSLASAKKDRSEAEARLAEYTAKLDEARAEATKMVDEGRRDAEVLKRKIEEDAKAEADNILDRARREIGVATDTAIKELYDVSGKLAVDIASKIIRKELDAGQHSRLIAESIDELNASQKN